MSPIHAVTAGPLSAALPVDLIVALIVATGLIITHLTFPKRSSIDDISGPITHKGRQALAVHKYKASDYTILDNLLNPWWVWCSDLLPNWMAPNVVTLFGWLFYIPCNIVLIYFSTSVGPGQDPHDIFVAPAAPPYARVVYFFGAIAVFWYQTFDAMDGKQARKLGVAGPLGQLMDHGCDAVSTVLIATLSCCALRLDFPGYMLVAFMLLNAFYISNWAEKYTHILCTNVGEFLGVTEGQYMAVFMSLLPALIDPTFWTWPISTFIGKFDILTPDGKIGGALNCVFQSLIPSIATICPSFGQFLERTCIRYDINTLPLAYTIIWFLFISGCYVLATSFLDVAIHIIRDTKTECRSKGEDLPSDFSLIIIKRLILAYSEVLPFYSTLICGLFWYNYSLPNAAIGKNWYGAWFYHPLLSIITTSYVTVHLICQVISNAMSYQPNHVFQPIMIPFIALISLDVIPSFMANPQPLINPELHFIIYASTIVFTFLLQMRFALMTVQQIANIFGIYILRLGPKSTNPPVLQIRKEMEKRQ